MHITTYSISNSLREDVKQYGTTWVSKKDLPKEFQDKLAIHKTIHKDKNPNISSKTEIELRGCPSLVGGRPAKPVAGFGRAGSNPAPRAISTCY